MRAFCGADIFPLTSLCGHQKTAGNFPAVSRIKFIFMKILTALYMF